MPDYILDLHGNPKDLETNLGVFSEYLHLLIGFRPGDRFSSDSDLVQFDPSSTEHFVLRLLTKDTETSLISLLRAYKLNYSSDKPTEFRLCCDETTEKSSLTTLFNSEGEMIACVSPDTKLSRARIRVYGKSFGVEEEKMERELARIYASVWSEWKKDPDTLPLPEIYVFNSEEEARMFTEVHQTTKLERVYGDGFSVVSGFIPTIFDSFSRGTLPDLPFIDSFYNPSKGLKIIEKMVCPRCWERERSVVEDFLQEIEGEKRSFSWLGKLAKRSNYSFRGNLDERVLSKRAIPIRDLPQKI